VTDSGEVFSRASLAHTVVLISASVALS